MNETLSQHAACSVTSPQDEGEISAIITASEHIFVATLNDGRQLEAHTVVELAKMLHLLGVLTGTIRCEWTSGKRMLTAGQQVALNAAMHSLKCG